MFAAAAFFAGLFRGFLGFGFALVAVPLLSIGWPLSQTLPVVLCHEVLLAAVLLPRYWRHIDRQSVQALLLSSAVSAPFGLALIRFVDENLLRGLIGCVMIGCAKLMWREPTRTMSFSGLRASVFGAMSGLMTGGAALSGPPVILYFLRNRQPSSVTRASLMFFFLVNSLVALAYGFGMRVFAPTALLDAMWLGPVALLGNALGALLFTHFANLAYRKAAIILIAFLGIYMAASGLWPAWTATHEMRAGIWTN